MQSRRCSVLFHAALEFVEGQDLVNSVIEVTLKVDTVVRSVRLAARVNSVKPLSRRITA